MEDMDAVVLRGLTSGVVDAAARHNVHVGPLSDVKVVIDHVGQAGLADDNGNVNALAPGPRLDNDVNARLAVGFGYNVNVGGGVPGVQLAVHPEIIGPLGHLLQLGDLLQNLELCLVHQRTSSFM